ncbi:hypothetical protein [Actinoplanes sp. NPDC020271]
MADGEIEEHRRAEHPDVGLDGTRESDDSTIVPDAASQSVRRPHSPDDVE